MPVQDLAAAAAAAGVLPTPHESSSECQFRLPHSDLVPQGIVVDHETHMHVSRFGEERIRFVSIAAITHPDQPEAQAAESTLRLANSITAAYVGAALACSTHPCNARLTARRLHSFPVLAPLLWAKDAAGQPRPRLGSLWMGRRPVSADGVPIVSRLALPHQRGSAAAAASNLWVNAGHGTLGFKHSCGSAQVARATQWRARRGAGVADTQSPPCWADVDVAHAWTSACRCFGSCGATQGHA